MSEPKGSIRASGAITALNPADGLFLRAEHLQAIQTYAEVFTRMIGIGGGTGVVYGFEITPENFEIPLEKKPPALKVGRGLATSAAGRSLRSEVDVTLSLADVGSAGPDGFWVVTVAPDAKEFGTENVYGNLCDEPCAGPGAVIHPWVDEGVRIALVPNHIDGLDAVSDLHRRSWLASKYFEREREAGQPWIVPGDVMGAVAPLKTRDWTSSVGAPSDEGVPIGAVLRVGINWVLDVWTARRDIGVPPTEYAWRSRLAMRPWNVFLAQVAQFQDQLGPVMSASGVVRRELVVDERDQVTQEFIDNAPPAIRSRPFFRDFLKSRDEAEAAYVLAAEDKSLWDRGFDELPPAGFLYGVPQDETMRSRLDTLFGDQYVDVRICHVRADSVPPAFDRAQHRDRIPLRSQLGKVPVDVLVPDVPADLPALCTKTYGWVAFVRGEESCVDAPAPEEPVDVYHGVYQGVDEPAVVVRALRDGQAPDSLTWVGRLSYPAGGWDFPVGDVAQKIVELLDEPSDHTTQLFAGAADETRRPLAALRANLFAASFDKRFAAPQVFAIAIPPATPVKPEFIAVVQTPLVIPQAPPPEPS